MIYKGFCEKQNKDCSVEFTVINATAKEDSSQKSILGRLNCAYAGMTGCCNSPSQCSILNNMSK